MANARTYFYITALSFPFLAVYNSCAALCRVMGNSKISMEASLVMNGINIAGNAIGVYVLRVGVAGVAVPTPGFPYGGRLHHAGGGPQSGQADPY